MKNIIFALLLSSSSAWALVPISELGAELRKNIDQSEDQLTCREWDLNYLHVKTGVSVGFDVPGILNVEVMPQFTLIWTKD